MGMRRTCCGLLFWLKAFIAFCAACGIYGFFIWKVVTDYKPFEQRAFDNSGFNPVIQVNTSLPQCDASRTGLARLEPADGQVMWGLHIRWQPTYYPVDYARKIGKRPPVFNSFIQLDPRDTADPFRRGDLNAHAKDCKDTNSILAVTLMPVARIDTIPDRLYEEFAEFITELNIRYGIYIFVRFGHEMNGFWTDYGYRPVAYKAGFRKLSAAIRARTNMVALVWAPNVGIAYPFAPGAGDELNSPFPTAATEPAELREVDTNGDGQLTADDDPYLPYYPGDDVVDWVGVSIYHYPEPRSSNTLPLPESAANLILGNNLPLRNFYQRFSVERNKPMMIPESGAPFIPNPADAAPGPGELAIKQTWWRQILSPEFRRQFPKIKAIVNFEDAKVESGSFRNWAIFDSAAIYNPFLTDLPQYDQNLIWNFNTFTCDGKINA